MTSTNEQLAVRPHLQPNQSASALVRADIAALEARLAANEEEAGRVEKDLGQDYRALLANDQAAAGAQQRLEVLRLDRRALEAGIEAATAALGVSVEQERVEAALELRGALEAGLSERNRAAAQVDEATAVLAECLAHLHNGQVAAQAALNQVATRLPSSLVTSPGVELSDRGYLVHDLGAPLLNAEHIQQLVKLRLFVLTGGAWKHEHIPPTGARRTIEDKIAESSRQILSAFDIHTHLVDDHTSRPIVVAPSAEDLAEDERMRQEKAAYMASKARRAAGIVDDGEDE